MSKMYDLYVSETQDPVKKNVYRPVFNYNFNLGFGCPRSDTCTTCDEYNGSETAKKIVEHQQDSKPGDRLMAEDRERALSIPGINYITFNLEKCLPLPRLTTRLVYYKRQLNLYNMIIHVCNINVENGFMHLWPETVGGRGPSEVGSCLLVSTDWSKMIPGELIAWSDSCAGQNKNFIVVCVWQLLILRGLFTSITHKFPFGGKIEKQVKETDNIYDIDGYVHCIRDAKNKNKFEIRKMDKCFVDMNKVIKDLKLVKRTENEQGEKIQFMARVLQIRVNKFGYYQYKHSLKEEDESKQVCLFPKTKARVISDAPVVPYLPVQNRALKKRKSKT